MFEEAEVEDAGLEVAETVGFDAEFGGAGEDVGEEFAVGFGAVGAEVFEDVGEGVGGHGDLEEMVEERDDGVVGAGFAAKVLRGVVGVAFVDYAVGEEGLVLWGGVRWWGKREDEEGGRLTVMPKMKVR